MKQITIAEQPWLGIGRTVSITVDGIRYRLFRASVTVAVIAVAVAFLMNILAESLIKRAVAQNTRDRIRRARMVYDWSAKLTAPGSRASVLSELAASVPGSAAYRETGVLGGLSEEKLSDFHAKATRAVAYMGFFNDLDYAKRRSLVHTASGIEVFERLRTADGMEQFKTGIDRIKSLRFVSSQEELDGFLVEWPATKALATQVLTGRKRAITVVSKALNGRTILQALSDADGAFGDTVRAAGFVLGAEQVAPIVSEQAKRLMDVLRLEESMEHRPVRQLIAQQANVLPADVNTMMMWDMLDSKKLAGRYLEKMAESGLDTTGLNAERLVMLAEARTERAALLRAERLTMDAGGGFLGLGERLSWLLFVSMLVCGIGICNAMLMTVTERFTEIATLKCLGALDGFIMIMFVLESSVLGVVGGAFGAVIGALIGLGRMLTAFGSNFISAIPALDIIQGMFVSVVIGTLLAAIAAVLPSFKAARLAPMEAMRIE